MDGGVESIVKGGRGNKGYAKDRIVCFSLFLFSKNGRRLEEQRVISDVTLTCHAKKKKKNLPLLLAGY